ncbi:hypothetical protein FRC01_013809, partial [Tulasnella sp. 417]
MHEYSEWSEERRWRHYPQHPNGTLITGLEGLQTAPVRLRLTPLLRRRLTESEIAAAAQETISLSSSPGQRKTIPSLPPAIVREIIRHSTDPFPAPFSIHHPSPSTSQLLSTPPPSNYRFPHSSYAFQEDREIDRKLHALSMKRKLSVSLVSRAWRNVAVEFLFNSIRISSWRQVPLLWHAFERDARRRGEQASKKTIARPGSAPWWIRELWMDFEMMKYESLPDPTEFSLADLVKMCPNIVVLRGLGTLKESLWLVETHMAALKPVSDLLGGLEGRVRDEGHEVQGSDIDGSDTGRWIELSIAFDWDFRLPPFGDQLPAMPRILTLPYVFSMELRSLYLLMSMKRGDYNAFRLSNLVHLSLRGGHSISCATTSLILPSLRSITIFADARQPRAFQKEPHLPNFLEKHGHGLEEVTVLERRYLAQLHMLDCLCPILQTFRTHYLSLPSSYVPSVKTVGLYGLEHAGRGLESGDSVISNIFKVFPEVTTIQDLSWRSGVIRRRAYTNWTDPEGAKWRQFWAQVLHAVRRGPESPLPMEGSEQLSVQEVALLDWRGKLVEPPPTKPPGSLSVMGPDDQLLDALLFQMLVDFILDNWRESRKRSEKQKWMNYPLYPNGTIITGRLTESELDATAQEPALLSSPTDQRKTAPFLPPEILREIILQATDTFPAPFSIHYPRPSASQSLSPPPPPHPRFPYSSYASKEDRGIDRKLHALSMEIKLSVSRVSRAWRDVGVEFLFNSIRISDMKQVPLLWDALECDAKRRGEQLSKETIASPGSAPWWIRELWIDLEMIKLIVRPSSWELNLADLSNICPNIVVFRGLGHWEQSQVPSLLRYTGLLEQLLRLPGERGDETHVETHEMPGREPESTGKGRMVELCFAFEWEQRLSLFGKWPRTTPHTLILPCVFSMELQSIYLLMATNPLVTFRLPNLAHLSLRGEDSIVCATTSLILPSLRSVTFGADARGPRTYQMGTRVWNFLEKHGLALEELTVLERLYLSSFQRLDQLCPILQTFRTHYRQLPSPSVPSVKTVGLYGLEEAGRKNESGETVIASIFRVFPGVTTIQDLSWRSGVIRRRAYMNWTDPEGMKWRQFWAQVICAVRRGPESRILMNGEPFPGREVALLDWRGKPVDAVPTNPPEDMRAILDPDDQLLDALKMGEGAKMEEIFTVPQWDPHYGAFNTIRAGCCDSSNNTPFVHHRAESSIPFLPPEIIREIIRHATDTFPVPSSIHCPSPSTSQFLLARRPHLRFPYSGCSLREDVEIDRKLHAMSMKIKFSVSGVSREWQYIGLEFLFNSIRIHDMRQIPLLWRAFEGDAKRRGMQPTKETIARPGSPPWWIRELWIDFEELKCVDLPDSTEFQLADLLRICPNILKYRGLGSWKPLHFPRRFRDDAVLRQLLGIPDGWGDGTHAEPHEVQGDEARGDARGVQSSDLDVPDTGRRIELYFALDWEPSLLPFSDLPIPTPRTLTLPCISSLELRSLNILIKEMMTNTTVRLPNLIHLSLRGTDSLTYATTRLVLPSLRSVTLGSSIMSQPGLLTDSDLESFLEKHGSALEELTILETRCSRYLRRLDQLCPILQTFRTDYLQLPRSAIPSVRTVGLYGLEHAGGDSESGERLVFSIFKVFPGVSTIQDLSWRSSVIRRRAFTNWTDPEGAKRRVFWAQVRRAVEVGSGLLHHMGRNEHIPVEEVTLLDWTGKPVTAVPLKPPEGQQAILGPDDQLLDALLIVEKRRESREKAEERKWRHYPQYPNRTLITGRLTESELIATTQATTSLSSTTGQTSSVPFLPPEIVREIIRHATDTFPSPSSIHHPSPSTSQSLSPPLPHPVFPYSGYLKEETEIDRKLHALSMKIKLSVSGVSRAWRTVAVEFLFNSIRIHDVRQIPLLWRAFEGDAKRRGEQASKKTIAGPGSAPWWIRELWIDFEDIKNIAGSMEFDLADLLKICPNILKYRGLGSRKQLHFSPGWRDTTVLQQLLGLPDVWSNETHSRPHQVQDAETQGDVQVTKGSNFDIPDTGRRIELCFALDWEPSLRLFSDPLTSAHRTLTLPWISSLELRALNMFMTMHPVVTYTFRLPNLAHLSLRGWETLDYATMRLLLPSLRSVTLGSNTVMPLRFPPDPDLEGFLEKHGLALEELTILEKPYSKYLQKLNHLCPILHTFRTHYLDLPRSAILSVTTVGLYGLEHAVGKSESGESLIFNIFEVFPGVAIIQDMSWRSDVIRRRAFTNWTDPDGVRHRAYWTEVFRTARAMGRNGQSSGPEVTLLDWRGKPVDDVPTKPPGGQLAPDDQLLDALVSRARGRAEEQKWRHYPQYPNGTLITGRLTESELAATTRATAHVAPSTGQGSPVPFLPPEIVREIIRHATDTSPAPASIHCTRPSTSQPPSAPPPGTRFPYLSYAFQEDRDIDRKLHTLSMKIKLSVSRVSRAWRNLAVEFLFNSIRVQDSAQIPLLWHAFEGDAKRRGDQLSKETIARPGTAPWYIRELWIDFEKMKHVVQSDPTKPLPSFDLADFLKMCPNIVVYRGLGSWRQFQFPPLMKHTAILKQVLGLPSEQEDEPHSEAHEIHGSELKVPDTGRRIELSFAFEREPSFTPLSNLPILTPRALALPCISALELRSLYLFVTTNMATYNTFQLPNLVHLSLRGGDSLGYATRRLILPSLRSVTYCADTVKPNRLRGEPYLEAFLLKHGLGLGELTVLEKSDLESLQGLDQLCPTLQTFRTHYLELPRTVLLSVTTVGLYGLEHAGKNSESGESVVSSIFAVFPGLSWRSSVIRRRAYANWTDPEGAKRRVFWTQVHRTIRTGLEYPRAAGGNEQFSVREVTFLDWRGNPVEVVPTMPPRDQRAMLSPDDRLLDALAKARKWKAYPQYWNGTIITGRLTDAEQAAQGQARYSTSKNPGDLAPFLPPEIVREIILHATDTFPAPCSIHRPSPTSSENPISPSSQPPFPYSSCEFREDTDTDRKLHSRSMQIKLTVSRVSRMWRDIAAEFLFNSILIQNSKQIPLLWRAFEADAKRRGEAASKDTVAQHGAAPWWIREVWVDLDKFQHVVQPDSEDPLPSFDLSGLLRICPNIVVYRGLGRWKEFQFQALLKEGAVLKQILDLPAEGGEEPGQETQGGELAAPGTNRLIELSLIYDYEPFLPLFHERTVSISTPLIVTLPSIASMELRSLVLPRFTHQLEYVTIHLPNLTHLSLWGIDSL